MLMTHYSHKIYKYKEGISLLDYMERFIEYSAHSILLKLLYFVDLNKFIELIWDIEIEIIISDRS